MSQETVDRQQQKVSEFLKLLPLTLELAGLPRAETGKILTEGQLESRAISVRAAYKMARQLVIDLSK
jgi:hypothetical protein